MPIAGESALSYLVILVVLALEIAAWWRVCAKAGRPGWYALIPFVNIWQICVVVRRPGWWFFLFLVPFVNVVIALIVMIDLAREFHMKTWFGIGRWLVPIVFGPILGLGPARYRRPEHLAAPPARS